MCLEYFDTKVEHNTSWTVQGRPGNHNHSKCIVCRCTCSSCSLKNVVKGQECSWCQEEERCVDMMEELDEPVDCITLHPGFNSVCLDKWVLETAAVRLKTKKKKKKLIQLSCHKATQQWQGMGNWISNEFYRHIFHPSVFSTPPFRHTAFSRKWIGYICQVICS